MIKKGVILLVILSAILINLTLATTTEYSREFQIKLNDKNFQNGRDQGIQVYFDSFENAAGINLDTTLPFSYTSIREELGINTDGCSGKKGGFSLRDFVWGDFDGRKVTQVKTSGALDTVDEALDEPFRVSSAYSDQTITYIEYDIHACEADWSSTSRITMDTADFPPLNTCEDLHSIFPDAVKGSNNAISTDSNGFIYSAFRNGTYLGGILTLDCTLSYDTLDDAINDNNYKGGEFSFTWYASDQKNGEWSNQQTEKSIQIYEDMLKDVGSDDEYPCNPPVDINDFFDDNNNNGNNNNDRSSNNSDSNLLLPSLLLISLTLLL